MAELILMRHAAALPAAMGASDFGRSLSAPGRAAAAQSARRLAAAGVRVERLLYSPAQRARETATIVARELSLATAMLESVPELYGATPQALRETIERLHGGAPILMVVGHNPGISDFGWELASDHSHDHLPTAGFWRLPLDTGRWQLLTHRAGNQAM